MKCIECLEKLNVNTIFITLNNESKGSTAIVYIVAHNICNEYN